MTLKDAPQPAPEEVRAWWETARRCADGMLRGRRIDGIHDAEDVAQTVVRRLLRHAPLLASLDTENRDSYIAVVVRRVVIDEYRKHVQRREKGRTVSLEALGAELEGIDLADPDAREPWSEQETAEAVRALVDRLPSERQRLAVLASLEPLETQAECVAWLQACDAAGGWTESTYRNMAHKGRKQLQTWFARGWITREQLATLAAFGMALGAREAHAATPAVEPTPAGPDPEPAPVNSEDHPPALPASPLDGLQCVPAEDLAEEPSGEDGVVLAAGLFLSSFLAGLGAMALVFALVPVLDRNDGEPLGRFQAGFGRKMRDLLAVGMGLLALVAYPLIAWFGGPVWTTLCFWPLVVTGLGLYAWRYGKQAWCVVLLGTALALIPALCLWSIEVLQAVRVLCQGEALAGHVGRVFAGLDLVVLAGLVVMPTLGLLLTPARRQARLRRAWRQGRYGACVRLAVGCYVAACGNFFQDMKGRPARDQRWHRTLTLIAAALGTTSLAVMVWVATGSPPIPWPWLTWLTVVLAGIFAAILFAEYGRAGRYAKLLESLRQDGYRELPPRLEKFFESALRNGVLEILLHVLGRSWFTDEVVSWQADTTSMTGPTGG